MIWHGRVHVNSRNVVRIFISKCQWQIFQLYCRLERALSGKRGLHTDMAILHHTVRLWSTNVREFDGQSLTITGAAFNVSIAAANGSSGRLSFQRKKEKGILRANTSTSPKNKATLEVTQSLADHDFGSAEGNLSRLS
jgi:hypothetical protein